MVQPPFVQVSEVNSEKYYFFSFDFSLLLTVIDCDLPMMVDHTEMSFLDTVAGSTANYSCEKEFIYSGGSTISTCLDNGTWSEPSIVCLSK